MKATFMPAVLVFAIGCHCGQPDRPKSKAVVAEKAESKAIVAEKAEPKADKPKVKPIQPRPFFETDKRTPEQRWAAARDAQRKWPPGMPGPVRKPPRED